MPRNKTGLNILGESLLFRAIIEIIYSPRNYKLGTPKSNVHKLCITLWAQNLDRVSLWKPVLDPGVMHRADSGMGRTLAKLFIISTQY